MTLDELHAVLPGAVYLPGDEGFAEAATSYHQLGSPRLVARPATAEGVAAAVRYAVAEDLPVAVRSGGHTVWGTNDGGVVIHLGGLDDVRVLDDDIVRVGGGAVWGDIASKLGEHGLALTSGDTATVGVGGLTLGGGFGWLIRKYGLALDNLVGAEVVTADGDIVRADEDDNADLFWALRGGGGNFGIVTAFEFRAHRLPGIVTGTLTFDRERMADVIRSWRDLTRTAPDEWTATLIAMPPFGPEMPASLQVIVVWAGADPEAARRASAPLLEHPALLSGELAEAPYRSLLEEGPPDMDGPPPRIVDEAALVDELDDATIDRMVAAHLSFGAAVLMLRSLRGAYGRVPVEATAFSHRDVDALVISAAFLAPDASDDEVSDLRARWAAAVGDRVVGQYGNFRPGTSPEIVASLYPPATLERLRTIKRTWDPRNVFARNHNIVPA